MAGPRDSDEQRLAKLEEKIEHGRRAEVGIGEALIEIKKSGLFKGETNKSFREYCRDRWDYDRSYAYRLMDAAMAAEVLPMGDPFPVPPPERVIREIAPLTKSDPDAAREVWTTLVGEHGEDLTYLHVRDAVRSYLRYDQDEEDADEAGEPGEPSVADVYTPHGTFTPGELPSGDEVPEWTPSPPRRGGVNVPIVRYFGSKWRMATRLIELFPKHRVYVEPYLGSAAVFLSKEPSEIEILNDLDSEVVNLFEVVRDHTSELRRAVTGTLYSEEEFRKAASLGANAGHLGKTERARLFLVRSHQGVLRQQGKPSFSVAPGEKSRDSVSIWNRLPKHFGAAHARLKDARILNRDALEVITAWNAADVLLYVDPPYLSSTRTPEQYRHEMNDSDHENMMDALMAHKGPVFLSGYASAGYDSKLVGWESVTLRGYSSAGARAEVVWMNAKAVAGAEAAERRAAERERRLKASATGVGMVYQPPAEPEAPEVAALFGTLLEGWRDGGEE